MVLKGVKKTDYIGVVIFFLVFSVFSLSSFEYFKDQEYYFSTAKSKSNLIGVFAAGTILFIYLQIKNFISKRQVEKKSKSKEQPLNKYNKIIKRNYKKG
jgi:nickel-dependent lactate racemase